jgi:3-phenylpropionate/trans-cinnamate dioxygenase ferredoxin reductase component
VRDRIVIVGAGHAAAQAIETLRRRGFEGSITLIGDETSLPYQRPPLSKKYLAGGLGCERLLIRNQERYARQGVELRLGCRALEIDREARRVRLEDGTCIAYDALLLATGSRPRALPVPGTDLHGVHYLRTLADANAMQASLETARRIVIVGGGYIGLEVAATCRQTGREVTVLEQAERLMQRVVCSAVSAFYESEHVRRGSRIQCNTRVKAIAARPGTRRVGAVLCEDGSEHLADVVLVGVGVIPNDELAAAAGLACSNGVTVDAYCRTSDPCIYAAGDCTNHPSPRYDARVRLESVDNAFEQATTAALNMMGERTLHDKVPWFWSDQYDLKLVTVGLSTGYDKVVMRGSVASRSFSMCYLREGELIAVDTVNNSKDQMSARKIIGARARPNLDLLPDAAVALHDCF